GLEAAADVGDAAVGRLGTLVLERSLGEGATEIARGLGVAEIAERAEAAPEAREEGELLLVANLEAADLGVADVAGGGERVAFILAVETVVGAGADGGDKAAGVIDDVFLE